MREPFYAFIEAMAPTIRQIADDMELRPDKCLARIRRDTRLQPGQNTLPGSFMGCCSARAAEQKDTAVTYWFELAPERVEWGLGFWGYKPPRYERAAQTDTAKA